MIHFDVRETLVKEGELADHVPSVVTLGRN